ncbi:hypothetical protein CR513_53887, partial [Mucuna pruriens]
MCKMVYLSDILGEVFVKVQGAIIFIQIDISLAFWQGASMILSTKQCSRVLGALGTMGQAMRGLRRLIEGPWTDTICNWSLDGEWISFASDQHNPGSGSFELYLIHPNRTGLRKLI